MLIFIVAGPADRRHFDPGSVLLRRKLVRAVLNLPPRKAMHKRIGLGAVHKIGLEQELHISDREKKRDRQRNNA
jgi:hypothetical protein